MERSPKRVTSSSSPKRSTAGNNERAVGPRRFPHLLWLVVIALLGVVIYSDSFDCSFHLDDKNNIIENASLHDVSDPGSIWAQSKLGRTRFIPYLTFALNYHYGKLDVWGYHLVNLLIHLVNAFLVYWLTLLVFKVPMLSRHRLSGYGRTIAVIVALLFVSHPLATQSVTYIVQRMASMAAMFYFLSVALYIKARITQGKGSRNPFLFVGALLSGLMAMFSKENAFTLPLTILLVEAVLMRTVKIPRWLAGNRSYIVFPIFLTLAVVVALRVASSLFDPIPPTGGNAFTVTPATYLLTQFPVIVTYIRLLLLPVNQNVDHDIRMSESLLEPGTMFSMFLLAALLLLAVRQYGRNRAVSFGIFWFFIALSIESSVVPIEDLMFEHRTYLPSFGFFLAATSGMFYLLWERSRLLLLTLFSLMIGVNSILTYNRNKVWKDELSLWTDAASKSPEKARVYLNRGVAYWDKGNRENAMADYTKAVSLSPGNYAQAYFNLGVANESFGQWDEAIENYRKAIAINSLNADAHGGLAVAYSNTNRLQEALSEFAIAMSQRPYDPKLYYNRGITYMNNRQWKEAEADLTNAIRLNPNYLDALINRAVVFGNMGMFEKTIADCSSVLALDPNSTKALFNRAVTYFNSRKWNEAIADYTVFIRLVPVQKSAYYNRGVAFLNTGQYEAAAADFSKVLELDPGNQAAVEGRMSAAAAQEKNEKR